MEISPAKRKVERERRIDADFSRGIGVQVKTVITFTRIGTYGFPFIDDVSAQHAAIKIQVAASSQTGIAVYRRRRPGTETAEPVRGGD